MRFQFDRTTLVFLLFVIIVAAIFGVQQVVQRQPPIEINIAVDPLAEDWVRAAATDYNNSTPLVSGTTRVQVAITVTDDLDVWRGNPNWTSNNHPHGWIPSSSLSLDYAPTNLPFVSVVDSLARTPLVWGGFNNRVQVITVNDTRAFDWTAVQEIAVAQRWDNGGNVNMAMNWPSSSMAGVGALLSAAGSFHSTETVNRDLLNDAAFASWFQPLDDSVRNSQRIGGSPAEAMAARGTGVADFALLPESQWLNSAEGLADKGFTFRYPAYQFVLDFPMAQWDDAATTATERAAVKSFADFLRGSQGQALAIAKGLRPVSGELDSSATLFTNAEAQGIQLIPDYDLLVHPADRNTTDALIRILE